MKVEAPEAVEMPAFSGRKPGSDLICPEAPARRVYLVNRRRG
jgi:hypothetical protein